MKPTFQVLLLSCILLPLVSCVGTLSPKNRAAVGNVLIGQEIKMPARPDIGSPGKVLTGQVFGAVGQVIAQAAAKSGEDAMNARLQAAGIDAKAILVNAFEREIRQSRILPMNPGAPATHHLEIEVMNYGLFTPGFLGGRLPYYRLMVRLKDRNGRVVFMRDVMAIAELPTRRSEDEMLANLNLIGAGWENAAAKGAAQVREALAK